MDSDLIALLLAGQTQTSVAATAMPPVYSPAHNLDALLRGNAEFSFSAGAATPAQAAARGFRDFGNITAFQIDAGPEPAEPCGCPCRAGQETGGAAERTPRIGYRLTCGEWTLNSLRCLFFGEDAPAFARAAINGLAGTPLPFSAEAPSDANLHYDVLDAAGGRVRDLRALSFAGLAEGEDYAVDYQLGRVRFFAPRAEPHTPVITADAIAPGDPGSLHAVTPLARGECGGIGRLVVFDGSARNAVGFAHEDFGCELTVGQWSAAEPEDYAGLMLVVRVTSPAGTLYVREN